LNPNYATGHHWYGEWLLFNGRTEEAFREINLAVELEPVSPGVIKDKGIFYYYTQQYNQALNMGLMTLELHINFAPAYRLVSLAYAGLKMFDEAIAENKKWGEQTGNKIKTDIALAEFYAMAGNTDEAVKIIREVEADKLVSGNDRRGMALVYLALDDYDMALNWLNDSFEHHEESLCSINIDRKWDPVRSDERFKTLTRKIGFKN